MFASSVSESSSDNQGPFQSAYISTYQAGGGCSFQAVVKKEILEDEKTLNGDGDSSDDNIDQKPTQGVKKMKASDYDLMNSQEEEKRKIRRERNKLAAAKCRQRRVDLTNALLSETEKLEDEKNKLEDEIRQLECQRVKLQHILESHSADCTKGIAPVKAENTYLDRSTGIIEGGYPFSECNSAFSNIEKFLPNSESNRSQFKGTKQSSSLMHPPQEHAPSFGYATRSPNYNAQYLDKIATYNPNDNTGDYKGGGTFGHSLFPSPRCSKNNSMFPSNQDYNPQLPGDPYGRSQLFTPVSSPFVMDLSNPGNNFRGGMDGNLQKHSLHDSHSYYRYYKPHYGSSPPNCSDNKPKDSSLKYTDISANTPVSTKLLSSDLAKSYANNNYISSQSVHSNSFYKDNTLIESIPMATCSGVYQFNNISRTSEGQMAISKPLSCARPDSLPLDQHFKSSIIHLSKPGIENKHGISPRYQKVLELVLEAEDQCKMDCQQP